MKLEILTLAHGTVVYGLAEVLGRLITFLLLPLFTAYLSPSDYGIISLLSALTVFITPVFSLGLGAGIAPSYFDRDTISHKHATINTTFGLLVISTLGLVAIAAAVSPSVSRLFFQTPDYSRYVSMSVFTAALTILAVPLRQFLQFEKRARLYAALSVTSITASACLSALLVVVLRRGYAGMIEATLLGQAAALVLFALPVVDWLRPVIRRPLARELLRLSVPLVPAFACVFVLQNSNKYLLQWLRGLGDVGVYTIGMSIGTLVNVVAVAFQTAWVPYFMSFSKEPDTAKVLFGKILTYYALAMGGLSLCLFAVARPLMMIMTRPAFHEAWRVVGLSATAQMLAGAATILLPGMYIAKEVQYVGLLQGGAGIAGIAIGLCLIPRLGVVGAALSLVIAYAVLLALQHYWNRRRRYLAVQYEWRRIVRFGCLYAIVAGLTLWNRDVRLPGEVGISVVSLTSIAGILYSQLNAEERRGLQSLPRLVLRRRPGAAAEA